MAKHQLGIGMVVGSNLGEPKLNIIFAKVTLVSMTRPKPYMLEF